MQDKSSISTHPRMLQIAGFVVLFIGSFLDNIRGPLLPILSDELGMNYEASSQLLTTGNFFSCIALLLLISALKKWSESAVAKTISFATLVTCGLGFWVESGSLFYLFAALLGVSSAVFGALSNIFVVRGTPLNSQANVLSGLQVMYGLSSMLAPASIAWAVAGSVSWQWVLAGITPVVLAFIYFLYARVPDLEPVDQPDDGTFNLNRVQILLLLTFCLYVVAEVSCSMWMTPYMTETYDMDMTEAPLYTSAFFALMMLSRLVCSVFINPRNTNLFLYVSFIGPLLALSTGIIFRTPWLIPFAGLFGPFWPIFMSKVTRNYPKQWRSLTIWVITGLQGSLLLMNFFMGKLSALIPMQIAYGISPLFLVLTIISYFHLRRKTGKF